MRKKDQTCCRPGCSKERASTHNYCKEHWAEYQRSYKTLSDQKRMTASFRDGVNACVRFLRDRVGERAVTGSQAAQLLLRADQNAAETPEVAQRRAMIESLKGRASA